MKLVNQNTHSHVAERCLATRLLINYEYIDHFSWKNANETCQSPPSRYYPASLEGPTRQIRKANTVAMQYIVALSNLTTH